VSQPSDLANTPPKQIATAEILRTFLVIGLIGFGGPAAHIALMEKELVTRRQWVSRDDFLSMLAAINLVPGPNSTELAFHIGQAVGGLRGQLMAAIGFVVPAVIFSAGLAAIYVQFGSVPALQSIFWGLKPVILVLILSAAYRLAGKALDSRVMRVLFAGAMILVGLGLAPTQALLGLQFTAPPELVLLLASGLLYVLWKRLAAGQSLSLLLLSAPPLLGGLALLEGLRPTSLDLFWRFLVIGGTLFGSGYVLAPYMEQAFVRDTGWLSQQQLLDTLIIGQSTPGPVLSTSAAAGFVMTATPGNLAAGMLPAAASAVGVFLPAFIIVMILGRLAPVIKRSAFATDFLKGVNAGVIAILLGAFLNLAWAILFPPVAGGGYSPDWALLGLVGLAFYASERLQWTPLRLVMVGLVIGLVRAALGGL
jgi:chromate transporter